ncbi:MAG: 50S ribosomal protein L21 [Patescibacteria group bacterium]
MQYAIIKTGGKQYKVKAGDIIKIEKIETNENQEIVFDDVLLVFDEEGQEVKHFAIGKPVVKNAKVKAKVIEQGRDKKITVIKYKPKVRYKKKYGHRQPYTKVEILEITT